MTWGWLVQRTGKYCSIRRMKYPEFQTGIFGRMESAQMSGMPSITSSKVTMTTILSQRKTGPWKREFEKTKGTNCIL